LSTKGLAANFGTSRVKVFSPAQAALLSAQGARMQPLKRVLEHVQRAESQQVWYAFDKDFFASPLAKKLTPRIPPDMAMTNAEQMLAVGGENSGTQFHSHGPAFFTLLEGHKRWFLHKPGEFPNASARTLHRPVVSWAKQVLPFLGDQAPLQCVQQPGDTIFVPDSWAHATDNVDYTLGVAWQRTMAAVGICKFGRDYMCLQQDFTSVEHRAQITWASHYRNLFSQAEEITGGFPFGFLRFLANYWRVSEEEGGAAFRRQRGRVLQFLKSAKRHSDEAILAAALIKSLIDVIFLKSRDFKEASRLLMPAAKKVPEAGLGVSLAQLLAKQNRWKEVVQHLKAHLDQFPDDKDALIMLNDALKFASQQ